MGCEGVEIWCLASTPAILGAPADNTVCHGAGPWHWQPWQKFDTVDNVESIKRLYCAAVARTAIAIVLVFSLNLCCSHFTASTIARVLMLCVCK